MIFHVWGGIGAITGLCLCMLLAPLIHTHLLLSVFEKNPRSPLETCFPACAQQTALQSWSYRAPLQIWSSREKTG